MKYVLTAGKFFVVLLIAVILFFSCAENQNGTLRIKLPGGSARAVSDEFLDILSYRIDCTGIGSVITEGQAGETISIELAAGVWNVTVTALNTEDQDVGNVSVKVTIASGITSNVQLSVPLNKSGNDITQFRINDDSVNAAGTIDQNSRHISIVVPKGTNISNLRFSVVHTGVSVSPASGSRINFNGTPIITVTAENGAVKNYTVSVASDAALIPVEMVWVEGGSFQLGKYIGPPLYDDYYPDVPPVSNVTLTGFYMGKYEVTQEQYLAVMGVNHSEYWINPTAGETQSRRPVDNVSWYDAIVFCNKLSMAEGKTPAYRINNSTDPAAWGSVPTSYNTAWDAVTVVSGSNGYRLPTEAQWEYAAKGGSTPDNKNFFGRNELDIVAWHKYNSWNKTHEVGLKEPNSLGIYDMTGNVQEWCWDWLDEYTAENKTDPTGPASPGQGGFRTIRGSCITLNIGDSFLVDRFNIPYPYDRNINGIVGIRLVRP